MVYSGLTLEGWIALGRETGKVKDVLTVIWAYCLDEPEAVAWISAIVTGETTERAALTSINKDMCYTAYMLANIDWVSFNTTANSRELRLDQESVIRGY